MYLVGTPKPMLRRFESELLEKNWKEISPGLEVKTVPSPEGSNETFILCRSPVRIVRKEHRERWAELSNGAYLSRTNLTGRGPEELWKTYMQLNQAESSFRICKTDLGIRPVYHQRAERVRSHIFVCFLALALWRSLEMWMNSKGLGTCARKLLCEMKEVRSMDVLVDVKDRNPARLRLVGRPEKHLSELLDAMGVKLPNRPKNIKM